MQKRKYFLRRFGQFFLTFTVPILIVLILSGIVTTYSIEQGIEQDSQDAVQSVDNNIELSLSNLAQQNGQFANNPYMILSLKRILRDSTSITYADSVNFRSINATLKSTMTTYPYVDSIYLYLDGFAHYYTSWQRIEPLQGTESWLDLYQAMEADMETQVDILPEDTNEAGHARELTILQRMPYYDGVVVIRINLNKYKAILKNTVAGSDVGLALYNLDNKLLFTVGENIAEADFAFLPDLDTFGSRPHWQKIGGQSFLISQKVNEDFRIRSLSVIPRSQIGRHQHPYIPFMILMITAGLLSAMIAAYATTIRNFRYINEIVSVLGDAEKGIYPTQTRKTRAEDEYDVILKNIIRLHLQTEQLNIQLEQKKHAQELASMMALQAQINPHFMFNTLQMIQFEAAKSGQKSAHVVQMTSDLADIMKYALADPMQTIPLRQEISYLKKYVSIQKMRFGDRFIIYYEVDENMEDMPVFRLMLQPLIENSILHGIRYLEGTGYIKLTVFDRGDRVLFRVFDTGIGMNQDRLHELRESINHFDVHNIGISNVNNRLKLYFGESAALRIRSREGRGTIVEYEISKEQMKKYVTKSEKM